MVGNHVTYSLLSSFDMKIQNPQALPMSLSEVSAAVSALLGFSPPATLTPDGSFKVFKMLLQILLVYILG